ncbi:MAG: hypothetical protein ACOX6V_00700 [Patescibacteria group bacterium]|jgi:hypothetical protein
MINDKEKGMGLVGWLIFIAAILIILYTFTPLFGGPNFRFAPFSE